ncbi:uncharacterized protein MONBRDRAFT_17015 [Monosiga brevicollis MX1]|uniref:ODAD1 central coiled coil region domain-containing protein n=1 Tax=Monosiga brevicollis TaxID=81824 RepID=A9UNY4_MONBE|nr:uncharacterized protein MONBRDRAFT_17015 [Monosiga brevicollis MX1]EDQ92324.1 predicted protein [Monosiga brevicollis MX1]|eukprot:XP_001742086.1 hypothetical protein [Monosiga brevicollis MX1]
MPCQPHADKHNIGRARLAIVAAAARHQPNNVLAFLVLSGAVLCIADSEVERLRRQFRITEGDRKTYNDGTQLELKKQADQLEKLRKDNALLTHELDMAMAADRDADDEKKAADDLTNELATRKVRPTRLLTTKPEELNELQRTLKETDQDIHDRRRQIGGAAGVEAQKRRLASRIKTLENRVEQGTRKYNEILTSNAKLREQIDHLKQERRVFDGLHRKLEKELTQHRRDIAELVAQSQQAYDARDEAHHRMSMLEEKSAKELNQHDADIKALKRTLEHDRKLKSFMGVKAQPRGQDELAASHKRNANQSDQPEAMVQTYEAAFKQLKEATGIEETNKLVERFIQMEDQNFSLFNYVNELNNELESLTEQVHELQSSIDKFQRENRTSDSERKATLQELEQKLEAVNQQAKHFESQQSAFTDQFAALKAGISTIFDGPVCEGTVLTDMLGNTEITESNIMSFLGAIEQRANELLQLRALLDQKERDKWEEQEAGPKPQPGGLLGAGPLPQVSPLNIVPPTSLGDGDAELTDEEELTRPMSHHELKRKIARGLQGSA